MREAVITPVNPSWATTKAWKLLVPSPILCLLLHRLLPREALRFVLLRTSSHLLWKCQFSPNIRSQVVDRKARNFPKVELNRYAGDSCNFPHFHTGAKSRRRRSMHSTSHLLSQQLRVLRTSADNGRVVGIHGLLHNGQGLPAELYGLVELALGQRQAQRYKLQLLSCWTFYDFTYLQFIVERCHHHS